MTFAQRLLVAVFAILYLGSCGKAECPPCPSQVAHQPSSKPSARAPRAVASGPADPYKRKTKKPSEKEIIDQYHRLWYGKRKQTWDGNYWLGIRTAQNPNDVWIAQEIIVETKPDFIVETGAMFGGSAALWATILEEVNPVGRVISIDIKDRFDKARKLGIVKRHVQFLVGSSTDPNIVAKVKARVRGKKVFLILDSDHKKAHVLKELQSYWEIVQVGGYILVQDTNVNGHPIKKSYGPGPMEAIDEFLETNDHFEVDRQRERLLFTMHPRGWLKRVK